MSQIDTTALAAIFTWVWGRYGKTITDKTLKAAWERLRWEDLALAYGNKVRDLYGTMQILGQAKPVLLEGKYTAVSLLDRPTALGRYTLEELQAEFSRQGSRYFHSGGKELRRDGLEMVRSGKNLFILGKPGAGKTTFLKHVAQRGVNGGLERVPIFVGLKQLSDSGLSVFDFVVGEFDICGFPNAASYLDQLLKAGKGVLLFDGLDEVNVADDERARLISAIENFTRKYNQCQRLITCRLAANEFGFQNYTYVEMADFDEGQIREFVAKWFSGDSMQRERRDLFLAELSKGENEGLRELARVPLLLALLCLGFESTLKLSSLRSELYEDALDVLLKKWDAERNIRRDEIYRDLSLKRKEQLLAQVAAETFDRAEYFIPQRKLAQSFETFLSHVPNAPEEIDGQIVLRAIVAQHGLFTERARGIYSFAHLTFQEYFTARYIVDYQKIGTLPRLVDHYADSRYREVLLMTSAQLPDATEFFTLFIDRLAIDAQKRTALVELLRQATNKASNAISEVLRPAAARSAYLALKRALARDLALARDFDLARDLDISLDLDLTLDPDIDRELNLARDRDLALDRDLVRDLDVSRELDLNRELDLARNFDLGRNLDLAIALALARDLALDHSLARALVRALERALALARARVLARTIARALARGRNRDLARAQTLAHDLTRTRDRALTRDRDLTRDLARTRAHALARDIALANTYLIVELFSVLPDKARSWSVNVREWVSIAASQAAALGDVVMQQRLAILREDAVSAFEWPDRGQLEGVTEALQAFMEALDLDIPTLNDQDWKLLNQYINGNRLLLACLEQAIVDDREAIKDRLLLLPQE